MNLEDIYNQLEKLENDLEYYTNRLEEIKSLIMPQGTSFDKVLVDGRKHTDKILKYVEMEDRLQLEATIKYIKDKINHLNTLKEKEIERLNNIINKGIEAINVYQNEKTLSVGYQDLKRIRGILRGNEFDLKMFEEYLQELEQGSDSNVKD